MFNVGDRVTVVDFEDYTGRSGVIESLYDTSIWEYECDVRFTNGDVMAFNFCELKLAFARGFQQVSTFENISLPQRKTKDSAGYDFECAEDVTLEPHKVTVVPTGVKAYMQSDEYLGLHIRSGLAIKHSLSLVNSQGIVDADFYNNSDNEGHIQFAVVNHSDTPVELKRGQRIGQGIFYKYLKADNDEATGERKGGFGSSGLN